MNTTREIVLITKDEDGNEVSEKFRERYDTEAVGIETEAFITEFFTEYLHRTRNGSWFFSRVGGEYGDGKIILIEGNQKETAVQWLLDHVPNSPLMEKYFPEKIIEA